MVGTPITRREKKEGRRDWWRRGTARHRKSTHRESGVGGNTKKVVLS